MTRFFGLVQRIAAALVRTRTVLFFYDDSSVTAIDGGVVEVSALTFERLSSDTTSSWAGQIGMQSWFDNGGRLFALEREGECVSFAWAMHRDAFDVGEIAGIVRLTRRVLWIWSCFTPAEHRGKSYYPILLKGVRGKLGSPPTVIYCLRENWPSRRGIAKAGFKPAFSITKHRLFVFCLRAIRGLYAGYQGREAQPT